MEKIQQARDKMLEEVCQIDGGWETLAKKTHLSSTYIQRVLKNSKGYTPRISTLEKIKAGIKECLSEDEGRIAQLLS